MAIGTLFKSETRDLLERINTKAFDSAEEKKMICEELATSQSFRTADAVRLLFVQDGDFRRAAGRLLATRKDPETIKHFLEASRGKPEPARRAALTTLGSLPLGNVVAQLGQVVEQGQGESRKLAAECLLELPLSQETVPLLVKIIESGEANHRLKAVSRFAEIATDRNVPFFERLLEDPDERIRLACYQAITKFATGAHLELLMRRIADEPYATQQLLIGAVQRLVPGGGPAAVQQVLGLLASGKPGLRTAALKILLSLPDRVGTIRAFISYSKQLMGWVRDRALESLREFGPEVLAPALELISDSDPEVRSAALTLVSGLHDPRVVPAAAQLLSDPDWWIAISAADVLGRLKDQQAVAPLVQALGREEVRWGAVEALGRIGGEASLQALASLTRDQRPEIRIEALGALALSEDARVLPLLKHAAEQDPVKWVRARAFEMARELSHKKATALDEAALRAAVSATDLGQGAPEAHQLLAMARKQGASDLHVSVDSPPALRVAGELIRLQGEPLDAARSETLLLSLLTPAQKARLAEHKQLDACFHVENDGRYRGNLFIDRKGMNGVFRIIPEQPPTVSDIGLPSAVADITMIHQGCIVVTGPAGCGKSTTLAALVNLINETRRSHVLTLEDPVEFVHPFKNSLVNQREIGRHSESFAKSLRAALRENPDVIVIGEMRDAETVSLSLTAAETGHVVLATLNATTAAKAVDRVISAFPSDEQQQIRESFADCLKLVISQMLLPAAAKGQRVACYELLRGTPAIANLIRDNKTFQIPSIMQIGAQAGHRTFDDSLLELVRTGKIAPETAYMRAQAKENFEALVPPKFLEELLA